MSADDPSAPVHLVQCPQCRTPVPWTSEHPFRPFCSDRCRLLDLGAWAEGRHHIPGDADHEEGLPDQPE